MSMIEVPRNIKLKAAGLLTAVTLPLLLAGCVDKSASPTPNINSKPPEITNPLPSPEATKTIDFQSTASPSFEMTIPSELRVDDPPTLNQDNSFVGFVQFFKDIKVEDYRTYAYVVRVSRTFINKEGGMTLDETKESLLKGGAKEIDSSRYVSADGHQFYGLELFPNSRDLFLEDTDSGMLWRIRLDVNKVNADFNQEHQKFEKMIQSFQLAGK